MLCPGGAKPALPGCPRLWAAHLELRMAPQTSHAAVAVGSLRHVAAHQAELLKQCLPSCFSWRVADYNTWQKHVRDLPARAACRYTQATIFSQTSMAFSAH